MAARPKARRMDLNCIFAFLLLCGGRFLKRLKGFRLVFEGGRFWMDGRTNEWMEEKKKKKGRKGGMGRGKERFINAKER